MIDQSGILDRAAELRVEEGVLERLLADPATRVVAVREGRVRLQDGRVVRAGASTVGDAQWALLGRDVDGAPLLLAALAPQTDSIDTAPEETWFGLRDAGGRLDVHENELFVTAIALAGWLSDAGFCAACGTALTLHAAGWARRCPGCGREHFPRTDPAVIVAVESEDGQRLLLGSNATWRGTMYSCFAGFVEAGESIEQTVHRELFEEAGVRLSGIRYVSSQAWPYPRSLMIGFRAVAAGEDSVPDGEEITDVRWLTREEIGSALAGNGPVGMPGPASIANQLIRDWYEERPGEAQGERGASR